MAPPEAVTLDLFGTLIDFSVQRDEPPLVAELLAEAGLQADAQATLDLWLRAALAERAKQPFRTVRRSLEVGAQAVRGALGPAIDPAHWAEALEARWAASPLQPDAGAALDRLQASQAELAIVTNLDRSVLEVVLQRTGLGQRVQVAVCSEHARAYKPHPRVFRMALAKLEVRPEDAVHVGNSATEDRAGATAAGMRGCRLVRGARGGLVAAVELVLAGQL